MEEVRPRHLPHEKPGHVPPTDTQKTRVEEQPDWDRSNTCQQMSEQHRDHVRLGPDIQITRELNQGTDSIEDFGLTSVELLY